MIENLFVTERGIAKHKEAPLLTEREDYLCHLGREEKCQTSIQGTATILMDVIRVMNITSLRQVDMKEIGLAAERWAGEELVHRQHLGCKTSARRFRRVARGWFRFHGLLIQAAKPPCCFDRALEDFVHEMRYDVGLSANTVKSVTDRIRAFLIWVATRHDTLCSISPQDIEDFFDTKRQLGWRPVTLAGHCNTLRAFLKFSESRGWCKPGLWRVIWHPAFRRRRSADVGPSWKDVRRLIDETDSTKPRDCRAKAILLLCAVYGLRTNEITRLALNDFDWHNETFTVRRSKRGRTQQFPIQFEVGEAIILYLQNARPHCSCRNLFVTLFGPYRPLRSLWPVVSSRMKKLGIKSLNLGPHSLRHACATELLRKGTSLKDIADFLGHRGMQSVSIYAKYDSRTLRDVAAFRLGGVR
jgi:integrase/recombinase XerD